MRTLKKAGYDSRFRTGHYDGKGRIGEWILFQNQVNSARMGAEVFTTGPYMEMAISAMTPMTPLHRATAAQAGRGQAAGAVVIDGGSTARVIVTSL
ncbi:hypothetical protein [Pseudomonas gingeri]|uniref:hypothetical protein n=1 Tax=Pseudomonas gingeri TaxID=117681 RepID=UPI001C431041|nr:hypothetical protein [Pseudomonas gingeri]